MATKLTHDQARELVNATRTAIATSRMEVEALMPNAAYAYADKYLNSALVDCLAVQTENVAEALGVIVAEARDGIIDL